jgi:DNA-binding MarR family transcriptional regulator
MTAEPAVSGLAPHRSPSPGTELEEPALRVWRAFLQASVLLPRRLDEELQAAHGLSLAEYDALLHIANAPERRVRMSVLADRVLLSRSGITRLVDRLVADGMVERWACPTDARGAEAALTGSGLDRLREAARTHVAGIERHFLTPLDSADREAIERGLGRVADALDPCSQTVESTLSRAADD